MTLLDPPEKALASAATKVFRTPLSRLGDALSERRDLLFRGADSWFH